MARDTDRGLDRRDFIRAGVGAGLGAAIETGTWRL
jgi:hypothetical protein